LDKSGLLGQLRIDRGAEAPPSRSRAWTLGALVLLVAVVAVAWLLVAGTRAAEVELVAARPIPASNAASSVLDASGYVTARRQATVSAKITGKVREVRIEEGQHVAEGEILATLDDTEAQAQLELAQAQLEAARSQVAEAEALATQASRELVRQREMSQRGLASGSSLDAARAQSDSLAARVASARRGVDVARESVESAQVQVDNTVVRAPFAGVVTVKAAQPGEMISPISAGGGFTRTGIGTIVDMGSLEVEVDVNESYIGRVQPGQPAQTVLNAYPDWKIPGSVIAIIPTADRAKATVKVRVALAERDQRIVPDMGARVAFLDASKPVQPAAPPRPGVLVPAAAVHGDGEATVVYVERDGRAVRRVVTAGRVLGEQREITQGLAAGERVVAAGPEDLADGDAVREKPKS
jgi:RND family efflux transporter MFP subunit